MTLPLVDINLVSYNHEKFIAKAIDSVLEQRTNFEFRIIIGDDCSTDNTQEIIKDYTQQYPERIQTLLDSEHRGTQHKERVGMKILELSTAKYVALLDGDDYWTDPNKLQKQVDFLESHPDFAVCGHNAIVFYEDESKEPANMFPAGHKEVFSLEDLLFKNAVPTCSVVFRRGLFSDFPDCFYTLKTADWLINIMNAQYGKIRYIDEVMAAYRVHEKSFWSSTSLVSQYLEVINALGHIDAYLDFKYHRQVRASKAEWYRQISGVCYGEGDRAHARHYLMKHFWYADFQERRYLLSLILRRRGPTIYRSLRTLRDFARSVTST